MRSRYLHTTVVRHRRCPEINKFTDSDMVKCAIAIRNHLRGGRCDTALRLFNSMPRKCEVTYGTVISGCFSSGKSKLAQQLFDEMPVKNLVTKNIMIKGYIKNNNLRASQQLFDQMPIKDVISWNTMLSGYVKNGSMDEAKIGFDRMPVKDVVSWNTIISGCAEWVNGQGQGSVRSIAFQVAMLSWPINCSMKCLSRIWSLRI